jgi:DNA-binding LacI/PurR family transcriptional regulator
MSCRTIGVCIPIGLSYETLHPNIFFNELWAGIAHEADREGYTLLHFPISSRHNTLAEAYMLGKVEGLILFNFDKERASLLAEQNVPVILLCASSGIPSGCSNTYIDELQTVDLALKHLWDLGHRRIAHIAGPVSEDNTNGVDDTNWRFPTRDDVAVQRLNSYKHWMTAKNCFDPELIIYAEGWSTQSADELLLRVLAIHPKPTALFCANDGLAIEIINAANLLGINIPNDLSIVGVDGSFEAKTCSPKLTTVVIPVVEIGRQGFRTIVNMSNQEMIPQYRVKVPVSQLIIRETTAAIKQ